METEKNIEDNIRSALKHALERRQMERLSSNFSYRMMGYPPGSRETAKKKSENRLGGLAYISFRIAGTRHLLFVLLFGYKLCRLLAAGRYPVGSSFVEVLYLYSFAGLNFVRGRLLVA